MFKLWGSIFVDNDDANNSIAATDARAQGLSGTLGSAISTAAKFGAGLALAAGTAALALGTTAVNAASELKTSLNGLQTATGISTEQMGGMRDAMLDIYNNNFGASFEDIGLSMQTIAQQTKLTGDALSTTTQNAIAIRDTFGIEVGESIRSVNQLMKNFGIDSDAAYNLMAQGAQGGLNANENLADTINEYSVHFKNMGIGADEMFNMLKNGAASGVFDIDKLGDAVKEFGIRTKDGSKGTTDAFVSLGLDAQKVSADFAAGGETGKAAFDLVTKKLNEMKDPLAQTTVGTALFGTMWEDIGAKGVAALTNTQGGISKNIDALGKINAIKYDTFGSAISGIGRQLETGILIPMGEKILPILNNFATWIATNMPNIILKFKETAEKVIAFKDAAVSLLEKLLPLFAGITAGALAFGIYTLAINATAIATGIWATITGVATAVGGAFGVVLAFIASPIGLVVIAIAALIAIGVLLYQNWDVIMEKANLLWTELKVFSDKIVTMGEDIVKGLWNGIQNMSAWIIDKVTGFVKSIGTTIKDFFGISSPSKLTTEYGKNISEGLGNGIMEMAQKAVNAAQKLSQMVVGELDKLGNATIAALKNKYQGEEKLQTDSLNRQIENLRSNTDYNIRQYNREYEAKLKLIKSEEDPKLKLLQSNIDNINKLTDEENKAAKEKEYNDKISNLRSELELANSTEKKLSVQKELDSLLAENERQKVLDERTARIEAIRVEMEDIQLASDIKRENARIELEQKKVNEQTMASFTMESLKLQMDSTNLHYANLLKEENLQATARHLALDSNNKELISLLETYNPKWQDAGQTFGEQLLNGINSTKTKIQSAVNEILSMVNSAQAAQNQVIIQAQAAWNAANKAGDTAGMAEAHKIAVDARSAGGTIGSNNPINSFDVGTNYVSQNQIALIHEGEAIIPKKYNPNAGGNGGNIINITITGNTMMDDRDADKFGKLIVDRLLMLGVT